MDLGGGGHSGLSGPGFLELSTAMEGQSSTFGVYTLPDDFVSHSRPHFWRVAHLLHTNTDVALCNIPHDFSSFSSSLPTATRRWL